MIRYILAPAVGSPADDAVISTALTIAHACKAHVRFLHVRVDPARVAIGADALVSETTQRLIRLERDEGEAERRARATVERVCRERGIPYGTSPALGEASADFVTEAGPDAGWMAEYGRFADLIVAGRRGRDEDSALSVIETSLLESGRPILLAAPDGRFVIDPPVVIAWTDSPPALRAVHAASPFITQANRVVIACVDPDRAQTASADSLAEAILLRNRSVTIERLTSGDGDRMSVLTGYAQSIGAGLLVMGGYGHSPLRELIFGGATVAALNDAPLPVLMAH